jgi:DNA invertase Pin-like site-specific DNA recombinase
MAIHAAGYDRQSYAKENQSVASPASQRAANEKAASDLRQRGEDVTWVGHFSEAPGTSAFGSAERPQFERLLSECRRGHVNMIFVMYVSRFSRLDPLEAIPIVTELLNIGVTIVSVTEGTFRKGNIMDLIHIIMRLDAAHNESKNKSDAIQGVKESAKALGGYLGGRPPYGFMMVPQNVPVGDGKHITIQTLQHSTEKLSGPLKSEPAVIREMWARIQKHRDTPFIPSGPGVGHPGSISGICAAFETEGVPTRGNAVGKLTAGSTWDAAVVKRILRDPRVAGFQADPVYKTDAAGKKTYTITEYRIRRDPVTMAPLTLDCGPILPPDEWHDLQGWLDGRGRGKGLSRGQALLSAMGRLYCECGANGSGHKAGSIGATYRCTRRRKLPGQHEGGNTVNMAALDQYVAGRIMARIGTADHEDEATLAMLWEATRRFGKLTEAPETTGERASLLSERHDALGALNELYEDRAAGGYGGAIGRKHFLKAEAAATARLQGAEARLAELDQAQNPIMPIGEWLGEPGTDPTGPDSWWGRSAMPERRAFVALFIDRIEILRNPSAGAQTPVEQRVRLTWATPEETEDEAAA